ncbi:MAG: prepilin-type N-terminal cleavage/methylation domain-containing protein [bacterium]
MSPQMTTTRHAFSLIEVMMAVLILGLGLLGLGAIMPVVVKQQRQGADWVQGTMAAQSAMATVQGNARINAEFWRTWAQTKPTSTTGLTPPERNFGNLIPEDSKWWVVRADALTGSIALGPSRSIEDFNNNVFQKQPVQIPLADRVYPTASAGVVKPNFVFDMAVRRLAPRDLNANPPVVPEGASKVQVAIFVRRVDPEIRVYVPDLSPPRYLPSNADPDFAYFLALTDISRPTVERRWPVSEETGTALGEPTLSGRFENARYSQLLGVEVTFTPGTDWPRDRIVLGDPSPNQDSFAAGVVARNVIQPGQTLVDNLGNVYRVLGQDDRVSEPLAMRIDPPVPPWVPATAAGQPDSLSQVLVSLQPPVAVLVQTVNP